MASYMATLRPEPAFSQTQPVINRSLPVTNVFGQYVGRGLPSNGIAAIVWPYSWAQTEPKSEPQSRAAKPVWTPTNTFTVFNILPKCIVFGISLGSGFLSLINSLPAIGKKCLTFDDTSPMTYRCSLLSEVSASTSD